VALVVGLALTVTGAVAALGLDVADLANDLAGVEDEAVGAAGQGARLPETAKSRLTVASVGPVMIGPPLVEMARAVLVRGLYHGMVDRASGGWNH